MSKTRLALTGLAVAMVLNFGLTTVAGAAALFYNMTLSPTSGTITEIGTGSFSIDSTLFTGSGSETFGPISGSLFTPGLLSFDISSTLGNLTMNNDDNFPDRPTVSFLNGIFSGADYRVMSGFDSFQIFGTGFTYEFTDGQDNTFTGGGDVTVSAVPLPATLPLFLSGLAGIGLIGRKRRKRGTKVLANGPA